MDRQWHDISELESNIDVLFYTPEPKLKHKSKFQVGRKRTNGTIILGNLFYFDYGSPTKFQFLPEEPD